MADVASELIQEVTAHAQSDSLDAREICADGTIKLYVQAFLSMNTWMFETRRRHYNYVKTLMKNDAFCWFLLHTKINYLL